MKAASCICPGCGNEHTQDEDDSPDVAAFDAARGDKITATPAVDAVKPLKPCSWSYVPSAPCHVTGAPTGFHLLDGQGNIIAHFHEHDDCRLAAAAPELLDERAELLEALKSILSESRFDDDGDSLTRGEKLVEITGLASDALARATGGAK